MPTYRHISFPITPHHRLIVTFCLSPNLLAWMQTKHDDIQIIGSLRGFSSTDCLLFVGFSDEWSLWWTPKGWGWVRMNLCHSHHTWRDGNGSPENECAGTALPFKWWSASSNETRTDLSSPSNDAGGRVRRVVGGRGDGWRVADKIRANRCEEAAFLQIEKVTKSKAKRGTSRWLQMLNLTPARQLSLEWSVEKGLVKRDGRWWSERRSSNQSPWGLRFSYIFTGLLNSRLRMISMENPKDTINSYNFFICWKCGPLSLVLASICSSSHCKGLSISVVSNVSCVNAMPMCKGVGSAARISWVARQLKAMSN